MDLGFVGLGRMGANMVRRLLLDKHRVVAYNRTAEKTTEIMAEGSDGAFSLEELVEKLAKPRAVWSGLIISSLPTNLRSVPGEGQGVRAAVPQSQRMDSS